MYQRFAVQTGLIAGAGHCRSEASAIGFYKDLHCKSFGGRKCTTPIARRRMEKFWAYWISNDEVAIVPYSMFVK